jgi:hypothetical protein
LPCIRIPYHTVTTCNWVGVGSLVVKTNRANPSCFLVAWTIPQRQARNPLPVLM